MVTIPTVKILGADGFIIINKSDYDPQKHQLYEEVGFFEVPFSELKKLPFELRKKELEGMTWQELKLICNYYKLEKTKDESYFDLIPIILEYEYNLEDYE